MVIIGYNSKNYIKSFIQDLIEFYDEKDIKINFECRDKKKDLYDIFIEFSEKFDEKLFSLELWDITNFENNMYQELKISDYDINNEYVNILLNSKQIQLMTKKEDFITFLVLDDII